MRPRLLQHLENRLGEFERIGVEANFACPFCVSRMGEESQGKKLGINTRSGECHCFKCDYGASSPKQLLRDLNGGGLSVEDTAALAGDDTVVSPGKERMVGESYRVIKEGLLTPADEGDVKLKREPLPRGAIPLFEGPGLDLQEPRKYFRRGRKPGYRDKDIERIIRRFQLYYVPRNTRVRRGELNHGGHIIVPVFYRGKMVWFTTRTINDWSKAKSLNPRERKGYYTKEHCLLGFDQALGRRDVAVCEGPFSMFAFSTLRKKSVGAVALMGTTYSNRQLELFRHLARKGTRRFIIATEPDKAEFRNNLAAELAEIAETVILPLTAADGDPDNEKYRLAELIEAAIPYSRLGAAELLLRSALTLKQKK